jgi:Spy/CpxP family protein refolding chaperone
MRILKHWKVILAILLVFVAGAVTGSALSLVHFKRAFERSFTVEHWNRMTMKFLNDELKLMPEQEPKVRSIVEETGQQFGQSFGQAVRVSGTNMVESWQRIEQVLTPEQRVIYRKKCDEFRQKLKNGLKIELPPSPGKNGEQ